MPLSKWEGVKEDEYMEPTSVWLEWVMCGAADYSSPERGETAGTPRTTDVLGEWEDYVLTFYKVVN
jgi:hypothetical protein